MDRLILNDLFGFVAGICAIGCFTGIMVTWLKLRGRKSIASPDVVSRLDELAERMNRLDNAVEAVAVEIERISEGQRFTTKLLAERPGSSPIGDRARASGPTTPH
ncbi:MAG: hypothetical protein ACHQWU_15905 [Gemmatimonadales bacterium]|jgi:hypothetical protein